MNDPDPRLDGTRQSNSPDLVHVGPLAEQDVLEVVLVAPRRRLPPDHPIHGLIIELRETGRLRRPLTPAELLEVRGIDLGHLNALREFGERNGFQIVDQSAMRGDVIVRAPAEALNRAFGVSLQGFQDPTGRRFHSPDSAPSHPEEIQHALRSVLGLHVQPHRRTVRQPVTSSQLVGPKAIEDRYRFPETPDNPLGRIAVLEMAGGYYLEDLERYLPGASRNIQEFLVSGSHGQGANNPMPRVRLQEFAAAWAKGTLPPNWTKEEFTDFVNTVEVTMDLELIRGLAPAAPIDVYFAPPGSDSWWRSLWAVLGHPVGEPPTQRPLPSVLSISWGDAESAYSSHDLDLIDEAIQALVLSGVTVCCSSGDHGSSGGAKAPAVQSHFPASSPHALAVGGTQWIDPANPASTPETAWRTEFHDSKMATGGGMSGFFALPSYQHCVTETPLPNTWKEGPSAPSPGRWIPDVAALADFQVRIVVGDHEIPGGGTSAATPIWAALIWRIAANLGEPLGPLHHALYGAQAGSVLTQITEGSNDVTDVGGYNAHPGWNACTGLGTPVGTALLAYLEALGNHRPIGLHPRFGAWIIPGEGLVLLSERENHILYGEMYCTIASALQQGTQLDHLIGHLRHSFEEAEIAYAIDHVRSLGAIAFLDVDSKRHPERLGPLKQPDGPPEDVLDVQLEIHNGLSFPGCAEVLGKANIRCHPPHHGDGAAPPTDTGGERPIRLVLADDFTLGHLEAVNAQALREGQPWVLAKPVGEVIWISPVMVPGESACWHCLQDPLHRNRDIEGWIKTRLDLPAAPFPPQPTSTHSLHLALEWIGQQLRDLVTKSDAGDSKTGSILRTYDLASKWVREHHVRHRPQCHACGDPNLVQTSHASPPSLEARPGGPWTDGGVRTRSPEEVVSDLVRLVDPITGIIRDFEPVEVDASEEIYVYLAGSNPGRQAPSLHLLRSGLRSLSAGKGKTKDQAQASALAEAVERYSATFQGDEPRVRTSFAALGDEAIHPNACMGYSAFQFHHRHELNQRIPHHPHLRLESIPPSFDPHAPLDWTKVWSIDGTESRFLPTQFLYYGYPANGPHAFCLGTPMGVQLGAHWKKRSFRVSLSWWNEMRWPSGGITAWRDRP